MKAILADVAIVVGFGTNLLTFIDYCLTDSQRKSYQEVSLRWWNWLDDLQEKQRSLRFDRGISQRVLISFALLLVLGPLVWTLLPGSMTDKQYLDAAIYAVPVISLTLAANVFVLPIPLQWCSRARHQITYLLRLFALMLVAFPVTYFAMIEVFSAIEKLQFDVLPLWAMLLGSASFVPMVLVFELIFLLDISIVIVIFLYLGKTVLFVSTAMMRKIAEASTGPLLALGTMIGAIGAVAKTFAS
jgi:hypothetical protein